MIATEEGRLKVLRVFEVELSTLKGDDAGRSGRALVHLAAASNQVPVLKYLHTPEVGANFSAKDEAGYTAVLVACEHGHADVVRYLHSSVGADFSAKNGSGEAAAMKACEHGHADVVRYLHINVGTDFSAKNGSGEMAMQTW